MNLHIDVTSSCKSPINTGVQRIVRGIYDSFSKTEKTRPLNWSPVYGSYCRLSPSEKGNLINPFRGKKFRMDSPEKLKNPYPWSKISRWVFQRYNQVPILKNLQPQDIFFVPEIFQDERVNFFNRHAGKDLKKSAALFYDALTWSLHEYDSANQGALFEKYMAALSGFGSVICISRESEEDLQRFWKTAGMTPTRTVVIPLPMPLRKSRPAFSANFAARRILCVATLEGRKNHAVLLKACEALWKKGLVFQLVLIGRAVPGKSDLLLREIERLQGLGNDLLWEKHVDDQSLAKFYDSCSFTVYPSIREGFGLPILESLWSGRPCLCGNNGALGEVAQGGGCRHIRQKETHSIMEGITELLTDEEKYHQLYNEALTRRFRTWEEYCADLKKEFSSVLDGGSRTAHS